MGSGRTTNFMEKDAICSQMGGNIREIGFKEPCMEGASTAGLTDKSTRGSTCKIRSMDMEATGGRMEEGILESGETTSGMEEAV